jgi:hypothetical protein
MFLKDLNLDYSKFPYLVKFNEDSAVEPAHLTAISKFYYLLLLYYLSTSYMPVSGSASKCAIFAPVSDGNLGPARRSESTVDAGIRLVYSISGSNVTFTLFTRNPVLVAMVSSGSVFSSSEDTYLSIIPANGVSNYAPINTSGQYYIYLTLTTNDTYSASHFPQQYNINGGASNVLKYSVVSLEVTTTPKTGSGLFVELATATISGTSGNYTVTISEEYKNYIWTPKVSYVPSGSYSSVLSDFSGYDISTVLESILKYSNSLPGLSAINGIRKGVLYRGNISNPLTVSVSSNDVYISANDEWVEVSFIFGYKVFHGRLQELYEDLGLVFGQVPESSVTYRKEIRIENALSDAIFNYVNGYVYALYYDPLLDKIHMGPVLKISSGTGGYRYMMLFSLNETLLPTISNGAAVDLTADDVKSLIYDSTITPPSPPSGTFVHTYNNSSGTRISNPFGSTSISYIDNLEVGNIIPLVYVYKDANGNIHKDPIFRFGNVLPQDINLYVPGIINDKSYEDLLTYHSYSLRDFLIDFGKCIVSNSAEADDDINHPKHPILDKKLVSLNEDNRIDPSLLPPVIVFENSIVIKLRRENGRDYASIDTLISAIEQAMIDAYTYKKDATEFSIVVDSDPSSSPNYIGFDVSQNGVVRKVLNLTSMDNPFSNLQKLTLKMLLPIKAVGSTNYYGELVLDFDKQLSSKPVELVLDGWDLEGNGYNTNFEHTLILRIGSNSVVSYFSASSFSTVTSNITLTISNFHTGNGAALKFSNSVVYLINAYNSVVYNMGSSGLTGFPLNGLKIVDSEISIVQDLVTINDNWWDTNNALDISDFIFEKDIASTNKYVIFSTKVITEGDISFVNSKIVIYPSPFSNLRKGLSFSSGSSSISDAIINKFGETNDLVIKPNISPLFEFKGQKFLVENCTIEVSIPNSSSNPNLDEFVQSMIHIFKINLSGVPTSYFVTFRNNYFRFPIVDKEFSCNSTDCDKYYWKSSDNKYYSILTFTLFNADEANTKMIVFFFSGNSIETYVVRKLIPSDDYRNTLNYRLLQIIGRYLLKTLVPEAFDTTNFSNAGVSSLLCWWTVVEENNLALCVEGNCSYKVFDNFAFRPYLSTTCSNNSFCDFPTTFNHLNSLFLLV